MAGPSKKLSWRILILLGVILTGLVYISFLNLINVESNFSFFADPREELHKTEKILPVEIKVDSNIPKTVYRTWKKPFDQISNDLRQRIEHCNIVNKGWDSVYYDDEQMHRFFRETRKDLNPLYNTLPEMVEKADLFRYAVIHTFGGVYLDSDIHCNLPFDDMFNVTRFLEESAKMREKERLEKEEEEKKQAEAASTAASPPEGLEEEQQKAREEPEKEPRRAIPLFVCFTNKTHPKCLDHETLVSSLGPNLIDHRDGRQGHYYIDGAVGFESLCADRNRKISGNYPRMLQVTQWALAFAPKHWILSKVLLMIHSRVLQDANGGVHNILETTGPAVFTDAVEEFLQLRGLDLADVIHGALVDGLLILPIKAWAEAGGNCKELGETPNHYLNQVYVDHLFRGTWKGWSRDL